MTPETVLIELLERIGAQNGAPVFISEHELSSWPSNAVMLMKKQGILTKTRSTASIVCPGCEQECVMPVHILTSERAEPEGFIVCDKRSNINRVPVSIGHLTQWQASGGAIANLLSNLLGLVHPGNSAKDPHQFGVGLLKGKKHSSHILLLANNNLALKVGGHLIKLTEVLALNENTFEIDKNRLIKLADQPVPGSGGTESAHQRQIRIKKRCAQLKNKGSKNFLQIISEEESISVSRVKQILNPKKTSTESDPGW